MTPKKILTKEFLVEEFVIKQKSVHLIAKENGIKSSNSVQQYINKFGLTRVSVRNAADILTKKYLEEHYVNQNKSLSEIARDIGIKNKKTVKNALLRHGIGCRTRTRSARMLEDWNKRRGHPIIPINYWSSVQSSASNRGIKFLINIDDAYELYLEQGCKCKLSGVPIKFRRAGESKTETTASIDRIDSNLPYTKDNIQWVHKDINYMKMDIPQDKFIQWCKLITKHNR